MLLWLAALLQEPSVRVLTVDNETPAGSAVTLGVRDGALTAVLKSAGGERAIPADLIVEIVLGPRAGDPTPDAAPARLELTTGDVLYGSLADPGEREGTILLRTKLLGEVAVAFPHARWLGRTSERAAWPAEPPADRSLSTVYLANRDTMGKVRVDRVGEARLEVTWRNRAMKFGLAEIAGIHFMTVGDPPAEGNELVAVLELEDASRLRGRLARLDADGAALTDLFGREHRLGAGAVRSVTFRNGRVAYLSDLPPARVEENANYIRASAPAPGDLELPYKPDRNVRGGKLSIRGRLFDRGIGVHAYSSLTYGLGGRYERFLATVGVDDVAAGRGAVLFELYADGQKVASEPMRGGEAGRELSLDVSNVKELRLVVDFGEEGGAGDCADWAGARLIRKR